MLFRFDSVWLDRFGPRFRAIAASTIDHQLVLAGLARIYPD